MLKIRHVVSYVDVTGQHGSPFSRNLFNHVKGGILNFTSSAWFLSTTCCYLIQNKDINYWTHYQRMQNLIWLFQTIWKGSTTLQYWHLILTRSVKYLQRERRSFHTGDSFHMVFLSHCCGPSIHRCDLDNRFCVTEGCMNTSPRVRSSGSRLQFHQNSASCRRTWNTFGHDGVLPTTFPQMTGPSKGHLQKLLCMRGSVFLFQKWALKQQIKTHCMPTW